MFSKSLHKAGYQNFPLAYRLLFWVEFSILVSLFLAATRLPLFNTETFVQTDNVLALSLGLALNAILVQISLLSLGLYNPKFRESFRSLIRRVVTSVLVAQALFSLFWALMTQWEVSAELSLYLVVSYTVAIIAIRYMLHRFNMLNFSKINVLILGAGERASIVEKRMRRAVDRQNFNLKGFVAVQGDCEEKGIRKDPRIDLVLDELLPYVVEHNIQEIVVACDDRRQILPIDQLFACKLAGVGVIDILDFIERETGQLAINLMYPSWVIYSRGFGSSNVLREHFDWAFNALLASVVLALVWPFMLLAMIAIKLEDGWRAPVFYYQNRVGKDGKIFKIIKFRSMHQNAEAGGAVWAQKRDSRTTKIGKILRKYRIDELPQLYNVYRGEMGFVGPRPERPEMIKGFIHQIPYYEQRHNVKPGLTGWAQLKYPYGASLEDTFEKLKYDLYYVKHRSFLLDISILLLTVEIVLFGKGR